MMMINPLELHGTQTNQLQLATINQIVGRYSDDAEPGGAVWGRQ